MIVKFHNKSERIKGLSFHPKRPWLLAGLHTGNIQLWDYRLGQVIDNFMEHEAPVRSAQFHPSLCLFISGSDDLTVRIWNYKTKKCQFILRGHLDYVRCVNFHPELPWAISGSDDQTARVWNYQSRQMIAIVTGHSHYVMQCQFHPTQDLMITASLDQTIRLWSIAQLRKKYTSSKNDITNELELVQILEGHNQGVNWCSFHHSLNLIASSSDDKKIKLWKYNETRCWEIDTFNGHTNNVSCVLFHPKADVLISNSEDKTQRVWDLKKKVEVDCFTNKELDRFWVTAVHQDNYYFAAGSDSALYIFTLFKDRPPFDLVNQQYLIIGYQKLIKIIDLKSSQEKILRNLQELSNIQDNILQDNIEMIQYNFYDQSKTQIMVRLKQNQHNKSKNISKFIVYEQSTNIIQMFLGRSAAFIGKSKVVRAKENSELEIYNYETDQHTNILFKSEKVFSFPGGKILFYYDHYIYLVDPTTNSIVHQYPTTTEFSNIKKIVFNQSLFAIQTKKGLYVFTRQFQKITSISEKVNLKSLIFLSESQNIIIYTTKVHLKYLLMNGDSGILKTTENIIYLAQIQQPIDKSCNFKFIYMDNQWQLQQSVINCEELMFKQALFDKNIKSIQSYLTNQKSLGESLISYLYQKQYAQLALNLVNDKKAKFQLAIASNNLEVAYRTCNELKDKSCYQQLSDEAMRQGNHNIVEASLQQLRKLDELLFLYCILGYRDKLKAMLKITQNNKSIESRYIASLYLGQLQERINTMENLKSLQNISSYAHNLPCNETLIHPEDKEFLASQNIEALVPLMPIIKDSKNSIFSTNWPHNFISEDEQLVISSQQDQQVQKELNKSDNKNEVLINQFETKKKEPEVQQEEEIDEEFQDCQWGLDDEGLADQVPSPVKNDPISKSTIDLKCLKQGIPDYKKQLDTTELCYTQQYEQAINNLDRQFGLGNRKELEQRMKSIAYCSTIEIPQIAFLQAAPMIVYEKEEKINLHSQAQHIVKEGYRLTTIGQFGECLKVFKQLLKQIMISREKQYIPICLNYIIAMKCELAKKDSDIQRQIELACYMAICQMNPQHRQLAIRAAMSLAYKNQNYLTASQLARNLLKFQNLKNEVIENARKIQNISENKGYNQYKIRFEESYLNQGIERLCAEKLVFLSGSFETCSFDLSAHSTKQQICSVCDTCSVG